jgi:hypothetical protein
MSRTPQSDPDPESESDRSETALERMLARSRGLIDAPEHTIQRALAVFSRRPEPVAQPRSRIAALLNFDSGGAAALAFGMRAGAGPIRQVLLSAEGRDIDLRIAAGARARSFDLSGQILGPDTLGRVLVRAEQPDSSAPALVQVELNDLGEFRVPGIDGGTWHLTLELTGVTIELPALQVPVPA